MAREIDYETIEENLADKTIEDSEVTCLFECPITGEQFEGTAQIRAVGQRRSVFQSVLRSVFRMVGSLVQEITGSYRISRMARQFGSDAAEQAAESSGLKYADETIQEGVLEAFEEVRQNFVWDAEREQWIADEDAVDQEGWLFQLFEEVSGRQGGDVVDGANGRPELRWQTASHPTRLLVDGDNRPALELQVDIGDQVMALAFDEDAAAREDDPWADGGDRHSVASQVVALDEDSAQHFQQLPGDYQSRLADFLRRTHGQASIQPERVELSGTIPLNELDDRPGFVESTFQLADATVQALED